MISTHLVNYRDSLQVLFTVNLRISANQGLINSALHNKNISRDGEAKKMTLWVGDRGDKASDPRGRG